MFGVGRAVHVSDMVYGADCGEDWGFGIRSRVGVECGFVCAAKVYGEEGLWEVECTWIGAETSVTI